MSNTTMLIEKPSRAFLLWLLLTVFVFVGIHKIATRSVTVYAEDFKAPGHYDDQVVVDAVRELENRAFNFWWFANRTPVLVVPETRPLDVDLETLERYKVVVVQMDRNAKEGRRVFTPAAIVRAN